MARVRIRRAPLMLALLTVLAVAAAGCGSGSTPTSVPIDNGGCDHWCGSGSATVTMGGIMTTIRGGGCYDGGSAGVDVRFGDWQGIAGVSSYLALTAYRVGGPTPTPATVPAEPTPTGEPTTIVNGSVEGNPFVLGGDTVVTLKADGTGSFSGTDLNGLGLVKGTFTCS